MDQDSLWHKIIHSIKTDINSPYFTKMLDIVKFTGISSGKIKLDVPNNFYRDWILDHYSDIIKINAKKISGKDYFIIVNINKDLEDHPAIIEKESSNVQKPQKPISHKSTVIQDYTFDNFVIGLSNQFAHAASMACANKPAAAYNPLFIYGGVGLGKTHLVNAIGNHVLKNNPYEKILFLPAERFMNELINSIKYDKMDIFRAKYRDNCDVLLLDDIQFISGKERTQLEFFHTFNTLYESRKQIVITSDTFPKDIHLLEERLKNRFEWGLIADIKPPEMETRIAILQKKADYINCNLPDDVAMFLANQFKSNIRELEGSLIRLEAYSSLTGAEITVDFAKENLKDIIKETNRVVTIDEIQKIVSKHFSISLNELKGSKKFKKFAFPRQIAMYLSKKITSMSFPDIANKFGGKDHSTIIYACKKINAAKDVDINLKNTIESLINSINNSVY